MSHLIVIVITLISTITVDKQRHFIFQQTGLAFRACFFYLAHFSWQFSRKFTQYKPSVAEDSEAS